MNHNTLRLAYILTCLFCFTLSGCAGQSDTSPELMDGAVGKPAPGEWLGTADFGEFVIVVDPSSSMIVEITYTFKDWECGGATRSGSIGLSGGEYPIENGGFSISSSIGLSPNTETIVVTGFFSDSSNASGDWVADMNGTICEGAWQASPSK
jgi:hypothetical protein